MTINKFGSLTFLIIIALNSFSKQIPIQLSPYASGEVVFTWNSRPYGTFWHPDTVVFSSGTQITVLEQNLYVTRNFSGLGVITILDSLSSVGYKYSASLSRFWRGDTSRISSYVKTDNNPDTNWNEALSYPESLAICDSIVAEKMPQHVKLIVKAKPIYNMHQDLGPAPYITNLESGYNSILYIQALKKHTLKIQINQIVIIPGPSEKHTYPYTIKLLWAVDSLGNKVFKHDPVYTKHTIFNTKECPDLLRYDNNKTIIYTISDGSHVVRMDLFSINGKRVKTLVNGFKERGEYSLSLNQQPFSPGLYYIRASFGGNLITHKVAIVR